MTLLEAMKQVLTVKGSEIGADVLAKEINDKKLFESKNGSPIPSWRVLAAARKYRATFIINNGGIRLL